MDLIYRHKTLSVALLSLAVAGAAWWGFSGSSSSNDLLTEAATANPADQSLVETLLALRAVSLNGTILSDPAFLSLKDFGTQIVPEPIGRPNPFAPLSSRATSTPGSARGAQLFRRP